MLKLAQILLTIAAIQFGIIPPIVDFTETHVFHPDWPPHARFHLVWLLFTGTCIALLIITVVWKKFEQKHTVLKLVSLLGCIVLAGFFISALFKDSYGGSLTDLAEPIQVMGIDGNLFSFSIAAFLQLTATYLVWFKVKLN